MFGWMKRDPQKQLRKQYHAKLEEALQAQRDAEAKASDSSENKQ